MPSTTSSITSNFNGTAIPANDSVWFSSVFKPSGVGANDVTIRVTNQSITFTANNTPYVVNVPDAIIHLSHGTTAATSTTTFDTAQNAWVSNLPASFSGNGFLAGTSFHPGVSLPGGINPVKWHADFSTDTAGVSLKWQWAAAVYSSFGSDPGVKPLDVSTATYTNSDHAGTPERFKSFVVGGARGGGGSNFTGSYSATAAVVPSVETPPPPPPPPPPTTSSLSGYVYVDSNHDNVRDEGDLAISGVTVELYDANGNLIRSLQTDEFGFYSFGELTAGTYTIAETQPRFYDQGTNNIGSLGGSVNEDTIVVTIGGVDGTDYDFGERDSGANS